jgi:hypothetical protein
MMVVKLRWWCARGTRLVFKNFDEGVEHASVIFGASAHAAHLQPRLDDISRMNDARGATASETGVDVAARE